MFVDFFIRRPIFASVCSIIVLLLGLVSLPGLPVELYPRLAAPQVSVNSFYTGASAEVVESAVTVPLEQQINGAEGMQSISSTSSNSGSSTITVTFDVDRDVDIAAVDVQNRVSAALPALPAEVKNTGVIVTKNTNQFVLGAGLYAENGEYDELFLSNYANVYMRDALKRIPGVGDVRIFGERKFSMRLWLDPMKLAARQLAATDVVNALREQSVEVAAGQVGQPPAPNGQAFQFSVRAVGRLTEPAQFDALIIKTGADGALVRLKDVGRSELGAEDYSSVLRFDGRRAVGVGVLQLPNANALQVDAAVKEELARLAKRFPPGVKYALAFDSTEVVSESIKEVLITLGIAIFLVILVMYVFLERLRTTIIPAITIPVSLVGTFLFVKLFGFSINTLTLFGLTLAVGLVVDDAIVVIENIQRHIDEYKRSPPAASRTGMLEVTGAVIATSLVLIAVFVPVALFPGTTGRIYKQFALTLAFAVSLSLFNSLTLTPALSALILQPASEHKGWFFRKFDVGMTGLRRGYQRALGFLLRHRWGTLAGFVAALVATALVFRAVPTGFIPDEDQGYFIVAMQGPDGTSIQYTEKVLEQMEAEMRKFPEIDHMFMVGGFSFSGAGPNRAIAFINLKSWADRKRAEQSLAGLLARMRGPLSAIPGAQVIPFTPPTVQGVGSLGGFQFELEDQEQQGIPALSGATYAMMGAANQRPELRGVFSSFTADDPQILVTVDRERAKAMGVSLADVFSTMQIYMGSQYVNDFNFDNRAYRVYVQADGQFRSSPQDLDALYVRASRSGAMVPLGTLISRQTVTGPQVITHYNLFRSTELNGQAAPGRSSGEALAAMEDVARKTLPPGMSFEWSGIALEQLKSGKQTILLFALGLIFVFLVLAAQYESLSLPFVVIMAVPLAMLGALGAQWLRGLPNDLFCQVGLVMLIGLATKNAILIVEFANQLREHGKSIVEAAVEAAGVRLRPILMTSLAFILGVLPLVTASGAGSASRHSLGTAVFGGMIVSTLLNLLIIPVLYVVVESVRERVVKRAPELPSARAE